MRAYGSKSSAALADAQCLFSPIPTRDDRKEAGPAQSSVADLFPFVNHDTETEYSKRSRVARVVAAENAAGGKRGGDKMYNGERADEGTRG